MSSAHCDFHLDYLRNRKRSTRRQKRPTITRGVKPDAPKAMANLSTALELCKRAGLDLPDIRKVVVQAIGSLYRTRKQPA